MQKIKKLKLLINFDIQEYSYQIKIAGLMRYYKIEFRWPSVCSMPLNQTVNCQAFKMLELKFKWLMRWSVAYWFMEA